MTRAAVAASIAILLVLSGCSASNPPNDTGGSITVFAASSLRATFTEIAADFEAEHPGVEVELNFAGSSDLATQIIEGAPADVFASADWSNMNKLSAEKLVESPRNFATNSLQIAVPPANPAGIESFSDLARPGVKVVVCAIEVPCGSATTTVEAVSGVTLSPVSEESSVADVLGKVQSGEADAGVVYVTDVRGAGDSVTGIPIEGAEEAINIYPLAAVRSSPRHATANAFVDFVLTDESQAILERAGFGAP